MKAGLIFVAAVQLLGQPGTVSTMVGAFQLGDGLPAPSARLLEISAIAIDTDGSLLIGEVNRIRRIGLDGRTSTVFGTGHWGWPSFNGPWKLRPGLDALATRLVKIGPDGALYAPLSWESSCFRNDMWVANGPVGIIMRIDRPDSVTMVVGSDSCVSRNYGEGIHGPSASTAQVEDIAIDAAGRVFFSDPILNTIRRLDLDGKVYTVAGTGAV